MLMDKKKKPELPKLYKRHWLNEDEGSGYIIVQAEVEPSYNDKGVWLDASVEIKDCSRQIKLDFEAWDNEDHTKRLKKMEDLIAHLEELKAFMIANPPIEVKTKKTKDKEG